MMEKELVTADQWRNAHALITSLFIFIAIRMLLLSNSIPLTHAGSPPAPSQYDIDIYFPLLWFLYNIATFYIDYKRSVSKFNILHIFLRIYYSYIFISLIIVFFLYSIDCRPIKGEFSDFIVDSVYNFCPIVYLSAFARTPDLLSSINGFVFGESFEIYKYVFAYVVVIANIYRFFLLNSEIKKEI